MTKNLRCLSWIAVSSDEQAKADKASLTDQHNGNVKFIESIATLYPGYSGFLLGELCVTDSRKITLFEDAKARYPEYQQLFDMIRGRTIDVLVCHKWDRLGRTESLVVTIRDLCFENNIVVVARESMPNTLDVAKLRQDEGYRVSGMIQAWGAGREVREIGRRVREGRANSVRNNGRFMGPLPYGYRWQYDSDGTKRAVIHHEEASIIRMVLLDLYIGRNWGRPAIAAEMNRRNIPTPEGKQWGINTVAMLLHRVRVYAGFVEFNKLGDSEYILAQGNHPPILSADEAAIIERDIEMRSSGTRRVHPFSGVCECADCGGPMYTSYREHKNNRRYYMRCSPCSYSIREDLIIDALHAVVDEIADSDSFEYIDDNDRIANELGEQIRRINDVIADNEKAVDRLLDAYESGDIDKARLQERIQTRQTDIDRLRQELSQRAQELAQYQNSGALSDRVQEIRDDGHAMIDLARTEPIEVQRWMRAHFRIWISRNGIERIRVV
jgi:DNA invertase Pin-like site-specific DNA recombinase